MCSATNISNTFLVRSEIKRYKWKDRIIIMSRTTGLHVREESESEPLNQKK